MLTDDQNNKKKNLGRGLEALLGEINGDYFDEDLKTASKDSLTIKTNLIKVSPLQPRKEFDEEAIKALSSSIKEKGILQPLIVRRNKDNDYELIAGERRLRAAKMAGLTSVPVIIKDLNDQEVLEIALVENLLRENLSPIEEAVAYQKLIDTFSHTQEKVAEIVGKSRSYIANTLRLLTLPEEIKNYINEGKISAGHGKCLIGLDNAVDLADKIIKDDLNVRQVETLVSRQKSGEKSGQNKTKKTSHKDKDIANIEETLGKSLDIKIKISPDSQGGGKMVLYYASLAELDKIINMLENKKTIDITTKKSLDTTTPPEKGNDKFSIKIVE